MDMINEKPLTSRRKTTHADCFMVKQIQEHWCKDSFLVPFIHVGPTSPMPHPMLSVFCISRASLTETPLGQKLTLRSHLPVKVIEQLRILDSEICIVFMKGRRNKITSARKSTENSHQKEKRRGKNYVV